MKKYLLIIIGILLSILPINVSAEENSKEVIIYLFRGSTCGHCEEALDYMSKHKDKFPENVKLVTYEVWENKENASLKAKVEETLNTPEKRRENVPFFVVGSEYVYGYGASTFNELINYAIEYQKDESYVDVVERTISENNLKVTKQTLDELYPEPNKVVTYVIFGVFGVIIIGFIGMIVFSRK